MWIDLSSSAWWTISWWITAKIKRKLTKSFASERSIKSFTSRSTSRETKILISVKNLRLASIFHSKEKSPKKRKKLSESYHTSTIVKSSAMRNLICTSHKLPTCWGSTYFNSNLNLLVDHRLHLRSEKGLEAQWVCQRLRQRSKRSPKLIMDVMRIVKKLTILNAS